MPVLPWSGGNGATSPWGGTDPNRWRPEAVLANAASQALNEASAQADVSDAIVAVPLRMLASNYFEFGDGQSNAAPSFEWWGQKRPPVVATLIRFGSAPSKIQFRFDRSLPIGSMRFAILYSENGAPQTATLDATSDPSGDRLAEWNPPASLGFDDPLSKSVLLVHPEGWGDWFPVRFRFPVRSIDSLRATVPAAMQTFADGGPIVDHEGMSSRAGAGSGSVLSRLLSHRFASAYNQRPFTPPDIHARFPLNGHAYVTGVGSGWTWVANAGAAPFKIMYTCFERRRTDLEPNAPDGGVPSGGGWHRIGDPAETILNDLESGPIAVGSLMSNPYPASQLPSGGFAYNLSDVATIRWLQPGEAFVTTAGGAITDANGRSWDQSTFHWYFFQQSQDVCSEEWVHPWRPSDRLDFTVPQVSVSFQVQNAYTSWGQNVYVVGDAPALGGWNPAQAVRLAPSAYPTWTGTANLAPGTTVAFKFIKIDGSGNVAWESGANRSITVQGSSPYNGSFRN